MTVLIMIVMIISETGTQVRSSITNILYMANWLHSFRRNWQSFEAT